METFKRGHVPQVVVAPLIMVAIFLLSSCYALYPQYPSAWAEDAQIQTDPDVQQARAACAAIPQGERYYCLETIAVETQNPNVCGLTGIFVDDVCLQAVWQVAEDVAICDRIYLISVRPNCYAHFNAHPSVTPRSSVPPVPQA